MKDNINKFKRKIRSKYYTLSYLLYEYKWGVYNFFRSSQHWLLKQIPRSYQDKCDLIQLLLFAIHIDFVEKERGLENLGGWEKELEHGHVTPEYVRECNARDAALKETYDYIKFERDEMKKEQRKIKSSYEFMKYDEMIAEKDQAAMQTIVKYSRHYWT